jgi:hypothetical protein
MPYTPSQRHATTPDLAKGHNNQKLNGNIGRVAFAVTPQSPSFPASQQTLARIAKWTRTHHNRHSWEIRPRQPTYTAPDLPFYDLYAPLMNSKALIHPLLLTTLHFFLLSIVISTTLWGLCAFHRHAGFPLHDNRRPIKGLLALRLSARTSCADLVFGKYIYTHLVLGWVLHYRFFTEPWGLETVFYENDGQQQQEHIFASSAEKDFPKTLWLSRGCRG